MITIIWKATWNCKVIQYILMMHLLTIRFSSQSAGEVTLVRPLDEISAITHIGDPVLLTVIAEEVKVARDEPVAMATTVQIALFLPERSNSPPYFENDQWVWLYSLRLIDDYNESSLYFFAAMWRGSQKTLQLGPLWCSQSLMSRELVMMMLAKMACSRWLC